MESRKKALKHLFTRQQWRNRHSEQSYGHGERGREGEMYGESNMETYITVCKIDSQREFAVGLRELKQGLCESLTPPGVSSLWIGFQLSFHPPSLNDLHIPL